MAKVTRISELQLAGSYVWYFTDPQIITYEEIEDGVIMRATLRILKEGPIEQDKTAPDLTA